MGGFFDYDSPLMRFLTVIANLMIVNFLTLLCCIPIVTVGPAFCALHYVVLKIIRDEDTSISKQFFHAFKQNMKQGIAAWLIFLFFYLFLIGDFILFKISPSSFSNSIKILLLVMTCVVTAVWCYVFPLLSRFTNPLSITFKNAIILAITNLWKTVMMILFYLLPVLIFYSYPRIIPVAGFLGFSVPAALSAILYNKIFIKLEKGITEPKTESDQAPEKSELNTTES